MPGRGAQRRGSGASPVPEVRGGGPADEGEPPAAKGVPDATGAADGPDAAATAEIDASAATAEVTPAAVSAEIATAFGPGATPETGGPDGGPKARRSWRSMIPAPLRHGIVIFIVLLVIEYLVVPEFVLARKHLSLLHNLNVGWLIAGIVLEGLALFAYAMLTRTLLPGGGPGIWTIFRIDLATTAVAHVIPAGTAGSASLGYRLMTANGVQGSDAGFAMATQGIGSAVVLNVMLWFSLVVSIPLAGFHPIYVVVALVSMLALLAVGALVVAFTRGEDSAARIVRAIGRRIPGVGEERLERIVRHIGGSLRELARDRRQLKRAILWAMLNWLLDAASLLAFIGALGRFVNPIELFAAYGIANVLAVLPITPGGLGVIDASAPALLVSFGLTKYTAYLGVIGWRLVNFWLPIPVGAAAYISLKVPRGAGLRARRRALHDMAEEASPAGSPAGADEHVGAARRRTNGARKGGAAPGAPRVRGGRPPPADERTDEPSAKEAKRPGRRSTDP
ncbi:MAG TPA: lysylphosphatidylglycerol synthase transmembrane domain-containing protein [Acidimicrobiales bacterium]|nr:lysylphosphatidylglycerol synthase transmembrane domain-containing protein [Acidimicrobiales bacterium]